MASMFSKRSRFARSSSQGEVGLLNQIRPIDFELPISSFFEKKRPPDPGLAPEKDLKPQVMQTREKPRGGILTLWSPERETSNKKEKAKVGFGEFLKACSLCNKKFSENKDIFMYGYLGAFCSEDCRNDRRALDGFDKEIDLEYATKMKDMAGNKNTLQGLCLAIKTIQVLPLSLHG